MKKTRELKAPLLGGLTDDQLKAVTAPDGPVLIIAGAGTGKTSVITRRIVWLIEEKRAKPEEILALTFTEKAAKEMEGRVLELLPLGTFNITVQTFHAFGLDLLREFFFAAKLPAEFKVLTTREQISFLKEHVFDLDLSQYLPLSNPSSHLAAIRTFFSRCKDEVVSHDELETWARKQTGEGKKQYLELAQAYRQYDLLLQKSGRLDFGDLIVQPIALLTAHPEIRAKLHARYRYILIDEFQDTNVAQYESLKSIVNRTTSNVTVVGDDDQAIYRWRGAAYSNLLAFQNDFKPRVLVLRDNFRSSQLLLDHAYRLIAHNNPDRLEVQAKIDKKLVARREHPEGVRPGPHPPGEDKPISLLAFQTGHDEADAIVREIEERLQRGERAEEIAVLLRSNNQAEPFIRNLRYRAIPYVFSGASGLFREPVIEALINFLRVLISPLDSLSLFHLSTSPLYEVKPEVLLALRSASQRRGQPLEANARLSGALPLEGVLADLDRFRSLIETKSAGQLLYQFLEEKGVIAALMRPQTPETEGVALNYAQFFRIIRDFETLSADRSILKFAEHLEILLTHAHESESEALETMEGSIRLLTVHASKGLEFDVVYLPGLVDRRFPSPARAEGIEFPDTLVKEPLPEGDHHLQEERRLLYVGLTRARRASILSYAKDYGGKSERRPSPFLYEIFGQEAVAQVQAELQQPSTTEQLALFKAGKTSEVKGPQTSEVKETSNHQKTRQLILSPYQIEDYKTCPWKYRYIHILKLPILENEAILFGSAIHKTLEFYFKAKQAGEAPSLDELEEFFQENWRREGFLTSAHEQARETQALRMLKEFIERERNQPAPLAVEERFQIKLPQATLTGRIDLIFELGGETVIADYKTGTTPEPEKADTRAKESRQLLLYAFAYAKAHHQLPTEVQLRFLDGDIVGRYRQTEKDTEQAIKLIEAVADGINKEEFNATPSEYACRPCPFNQHCPYSAVR